MSVEKHTELRKRVVTNTLYKYNIVFLNYQVKGTVYRQVTNLYGDKELTK